MRVCVRRLGGGCRPLLHSTTCASNMQWAPQACHGEEGGVGVYVCMRACMCVGKGSATQRNHCAACFGDGVCGADDDDGPRSSIAATNAAVSLGSPDAAIMPATGVV